MDRGSVDRRCAIWLVGRVTPSIVLALERGSFRGPVARACAGAWARLAGRTVVRRINLPRHTRVVAVGGATLGGSGKTPLAMACALELAAHGVRVAYVGHAYRAHPEMARVVDANDALHVVGDEALLAARVLGPAGVLACVAPTRSDAIALAAHEAEVLILDGIAQTAPQRATLALLAVDGDHPWGLAGQIVPRGDLRAPRAALLDASDAIVAVEDRTGGAEGWGEPDLSHPRGPVFRARVLSPGARVGGLLRTWDVLAKCRVGLLCALGRPDRIVRSLARRGIAVRAVVRAPDHGPWSTSAAALAARAESEQGIDLWLATPKCALHLSGQPSNSNGGSRGSVPLATIEHSLVLPELLRDRLRAVAAP